ncbi:hypothetical protein, partial [Mesorhizobium sp. M0592]|uniref:hypothetical protein n=1 Tax=Mesorhizobium sp. M0592 TaxID=2956967 RepID=UPI003336B5BD
DEKPLTGSARSFMVGVVSGKFRIGLSNQILRHFNGLAPTSTNPHELFRLAERVLAVHSLTRDRKWRRVTTRTGDTHGGPLDPQEEPQGVSGQSASECVLRSF